MMAMAMARRLDSSPVERLREIADALLEQQGSNLEVLATQSDEIVSLQNELASVVNEKDHAVASNQRMREQHALGEC